MKIINETPEELNKNFLKNQKNIKVYPTINRDKGKRKVKVNHKTWIYTDKPTDKEAIDSFNKKYGITNLSD